MISHAHIHIHIYTIRICKYVTYSIRKGVAFIFSIYILKFACEIHCAQPLNGFTLESLPRYNENIYILWTERNIYVNLIRTLL